MVDVSSTLVTTLALLGTASLIVVVAYFCTNTAFSKLSAKKGLIAKLVIGAVLGLLAIYGTVMSTKLPDGTAPNVRELAAIIGGVTAGPAGGLVAGLIGGIHRLSMGGATAIPCGLATILVGIISGLVSTKLFGRLSLVKAAVLGFVLENGALALVFSFVPFETAAIVVSEVYIPMVSATTIGLVLWMYVLNKLRNRQPQK